MVTLVASLDDGMTVHSATWQGCCCWGGEGVVGDYSHEGGRYRRSRRDKEPVGDAGPDGLADGEGRSGGPVGIV